MTVSRVGNRRVVGGFGGSTIDAKLPTTVVPYRRLMVTEADAREPAMMARVLNEMQLATEQATRAARSSADAGATILGPYIAANQTVDIDHHLDRAPVSVTCVRAIGAAWTGYEIAAATSGLDAKRTVRVQLPATGTFYLRFG